MFTEMIINPIIPMGYRFFDNPRSWNMKSASGQRILREIVIKIPEGKLEPDQCNAIIAMTLKESCDIQLACMEHYLRTGSTLFFIYLNDNDLEVIVDNMLRSIHNYPRISEIKYPLDKLRLFSKYEKPFHNSPPVVEKGSP